CPPRGAARTVAAAQALWAPALLVLLVTVFHARGLRPGNTFLAVDLVQQYLPWRTTSPPVRNVLASDPLFEFLPFVTSAVESIRERGAWPLWNPAILLGHPSFADPLAQPLYPVFVLFGLLFGAARGMALADWAPAVVAVLCR